MTDKTYWIAPVEKWSPSACAKAVRAQATDGMNVPYPYPGMFPYLPKTTLYNGGCVHDGQWYNGEKYELPVLAPGYKWMYVQGFCMRIIKEE